MAIADSGMPAKMYTGQSCIPWRHDSNVTSTPDTERAVADAGRVVVEDFVLADLNEQRGKAFQIGEHCRAARVVAGPIADICDSHGLKEFRA